MFPSTTLNVNITKLCCGLHMQYAFIVANGGHIAVNTGSHTPIWPPYSNMAAVGFSFPTTDARSSPIFQISGSIILEMGSYVLVISRPVVNYARNRLSAREIITIKNTKNIEWDGIKVAPTAFCSFCLRFVLFFCLYSAFLFGFCFFIWVLLFCLRFLFVSTCAHT